MITTNQSIIYGACSCSHRELPRAILSRFMLVDWPIRKRRDSFELTRIKEIYVNYNLFDFIRSFQIGKAIIPLYRHFRLPKGDHQQTNYWISVDLLMKYDRRRYLFTYNYWKQVYTDWLFYCEEEADLPDLETPELK